MRLLQKNLPIVADQMQMSIINCTMIFSGINVNTAFDAAVDCDGAVLDYCRLNDIPIQVWSPFQYGFFEGVFLGSDKFSKLNAAIDEVAARYGVSNITIAVAWLLRRPARIQLIIVTMNLVRLKECMPAAEITLTRWNGMTSTWLQVASCHDQGPKDGRGSKSFAFEPRHISSLTGHLCGGLFGQGTYPAAIKRCLRFWRLTRL